MDTQAYLQLINYTGSPAFDLDGAHMTLNQRTHADEWKMQYRFTLRPYQYSADRLQTDDLPNRA